MKLAPVAPFSLLVASLLAPALAHADTFVLTSVTDPSFSTFTFVLPHSPTPPTVDPVNGVFTMPITATVTGPSGTSTITDAFQAYTYTGIPLSGGISDTYFFDPYGPQIFTGTLNAPTFIDSTFDLSNEGVGGTTDYILTITAAATGTTTTPEPSALVLLGTGAFGLIGAARRRYRR